MIMLEEQIKKLRGTAYTLDKIYVVSTPWIHAKLTPMLREAADTIESLRDRLQAVQGVGDEDWSEPNAVRGVCSKCSALMYGKDNYCPNCGRRVKEMAVKR